MYTRALSVCDASTRATHRETISVEFSLFSSYLSCRLSLPTGRREEERWIGIPFKSTRVHRFLFENSQRQERSKPVESNVHKEKYILVVVLGDEYLPACVGSELFDILL